ncbi:acyl-CoA:lysophosphatidylglycerol acyltransferase 1-like [Mytilus californianus]|uniref:acyl-CoA:lysophosphatidylglycerol acyltransferase 1-like n=1 Tax=Mytilus californianus TaxID=6549 RepID=UPI0022457A81|nr:acyl-CoA:lysophosphatidylglycerol acyltransferase 1-like [Mytilus californianus]
MVSKKVLEYMRYFFRILFITIANLIAIPAYIVYALLLYPIKKYYPEFYWTHVEPRLFQALLGMVASWLYSGGYKVIESGDDLTSILDKEALVLVNHQSTSDVPILMSSMYPKGLACGSMTWVMDYIFKFTNFGWISYFHEDFFICQGKDGRDKELVKLKKHMLNSYLPTGKKWIVVFPEGGFLYKRKKSSQQYAKKHNFPVLEHVTLPRIGAVKVITDSLYHDTLQNGVKKESSVPAKRKLKWVIDITIGYPDRDSLSFPGMMVGIFSPRHINVHYRAYPVTEVPHDSNHLQTWLYDRYIEKEELLELYYNKKTSMNHTDRQTRHLPKLSEQEIKVDYYGIVFIHIFYFISSYVFWHAIYLHLFTVIGFCFSLIF